MTTQEVSNVIGKSVPVLDKGFVELQDMLPHPATGVSGDLAIVNAARTSFLGETKGEEKDKKLLFYLMRNRHTSPFEQVVFKFRIKAPVVVWWQLLRYRTARPNLQSGRYVEFEEDEFYFPAEWRRQSSSNKQGSEGLVDEATASVLDAFYRDLIDRSYGFYKAALRYGVAKEQARLFLPGFGLYYTGIFQIDASNLMNLLHQRMDSHAQYEIREYAYAIYQHFFLPTLPWTAEAFHDYRLKPEE